VLIPYSLGFSGGGFSLIDVARMLCAGWVIPLVCAALVCASCGIHGEFDPGSGRTLAACLTHASRTMNRFWLGISGERVSNTWVICPALRDKPWKRGLIPDGTAGRMVWWWKASVVQDEPAAYQLVGGVMAYQGDDG
jgi:hypothetical protein